MSWKLIDRPKTLKVTKSLAKQYAEMDPAPHDRPLSERRLTVYANLLNKGQFRPVTWASAICKETEGVYRVNGKHTSTLLAGLEKLPEFYVTVEEYECDTLEDVAKLYATFDSKMMSRTANDIIYSFAATVPEFTDIQKKVLPLCANGISYGEWMEESHKRQTAEKAELLLEHSDFVLWVAGLIGTEYNLRHLFRTPVVAAMFKTWTKAKAASTEFWSAVKAETGKTPDLPDRKLSRYLLTIKMRDIGQSSKRSGRDRTIGQREIFVKCLHAWNAWRAGESTNLNYYVQAKVPAVK